MTTVKHKKRNIKNFIHSKYGRYQYILFFCDLVIERKRCNIFFIFGINSKISRLSYIDLFSCVRDFVCTNAQIGNDPNTNHKGSHDKHDFGGIFLIPKWRWSVKFRDRPPDSGFTMRCKHDDSCMVLGCLLTLLPCFVFFLL